MGLLNRKKKKEGFSGKVELKPLKYHPKILIGWAEAIGGNKDLRDWFMESPEYKELGVFCHALALDDPSREWLMNNGYAHLMAMINGVEGNEDAILWLKNNKFDVLRHVALAGDGDEDSFKWLVINNHPEFAMISQKIKLVKDEIEEKNNDVHRISSR